MKKLAILAVLIITACNKNPSVNKTPANADSIALAIDEAGTQATDTLEIAGVVTQVKMGKDGYTAALNSNGKVYSATISRANLIDPTQYKLAKIGDSLKVKGNYWLNAKEKQITVRVLK